ADKKLKEEADKINGADAMIFQVEKALKENGDKLPADKKSEIESALKDLKDAHAARNISAIDAASEKLNAVFQAASADMYSQQGGAQQEQPQNQSNNSSNDQDGEVTDADFEEVK
ncbi:MAG: Hsp70 family protein, partial [Bacteroidales bacterium]|nr:Hsp70 family protein [Bacteroidales bacterium]